MKGKSATVARCNCIVAEAEKQIPLPDMLADMVRNRENGEHSAALKTKMLAVGATCVLRERDSQDEQQSGTD